MNPRLFRRHVSLAGVVALALLAGCNDGGGSGGSVSSPSDVRYAYVLMGPSGQAVARAITTADTCPGISFDSGAPVQMALRAGAASVPARPTAYDAKNTVPALFNVTTCDAVIPAGTARATLGERSLPLPKRHVRKILLIGDTGCRMKVTTGDEEVQDCNDLAAWPYKPIADLGAFMAPDLVVHVGDFHYRETPCPPGTPCASVSTYGFGWASWDADFFAPSQTLFGAAPWMMVRGDHETCDRGGQGWWRFLDPRPLAPRQDCNAAADDSIGSYSEPYAVPLDDDVAAIVFDSNIVASKVKPGVTDDQVATYTRQMKTAFSLASAWPRTVFINHQPILAFSSAGSSKPGVAAPGSLVLQAVLQPIYGYSLFPTAVDAVVSGHVHMAQLVTYQTPQPPMFVSGNGGTKLDTLFTDFTNAKVPYQYPAPDGDKGAKVAGFRQMASFGFMMMERSGTGWTVTAYDRYGTALVSCAVSGADRKTTCNPPLPPLPGG